MRNLKRALSLALASVMVLGLMVVGSSAKGYDDVTSEENVEAIEVLQAVGIMTGDDNGNFNPTQNVTRNEMAVIMSNLMDYRVATYKGTSPFTDVPEWAEPYVAACYTNGIIAGYSATTFGGSDPVVTSQATLMILKALGYFKYSSDFGDDWQLATINQANRVDLLDGVDSSVRVPMTRNDVAQLVMNGLEAGTVEPDTSNKIDISVGDTQITSGTKYNFVTSGRDYAYAINRKLDTRNDGQYSAGAIVELGEKLYQGDLTKEGINDDLGRPATVWEFKTKEIGTYVDAPDYEWSAKVTSKTLYNAVGKAATDNYVWKVYVDGVDYTNNLSTSRSGAGWSGLNNVKTDDDKCFLVKTGVGVTDGSNNTDDKRTGNGAVTQVFVSSAMEDDSTLEDNANGGRRTVTVAVTHYYAAEVYKINEDVGTIQISGFYGPVKSTDDFDTETKNFEEDQVVIYSYSDAAKSIQDVYAAEFMEGEVTQVRSSTTDGEEHNGDNFVVDSDTYKYNMTMDAKDRLRIENKGNQMAGYKDQFGYVAYIDESAVTYDYAYVLSMGTDRDTYGNNNQGSSNKGSTVYARLVLTDGSVAKVQTNVKKSDAGTTDFDNGFTSGVTLDDAIAMFVNHIVSYTKGSDGVYSLSLKDVDHVGGKNIGGTGSHGTGIYPNTTHADRQTITTGTVPVSSTGYAYPGSLKIENGVAGFSYKKASDATGEGLQWYTANSNTTFIVAESDTDGYDEYTYSVYQGIKNVPDITATANTKIDIAANNAKIAKVVYIEDAEVSGMKNVVFIRADKNADIVGSINNSNYYELKAYVDGKAETLKVKEGSSADHKLIDGFTGDGTAALKLTASRYMVAVNNVITNADGLVTNVSLFKTYNPTTGDGARVYDRDAAQVLPYVISADGTARQDREVIYFGTTNPYGEQYYGHAYNDDTAVAWYDYKGSFIDGAKISNIKKDVNDKALVVLSSNVLSGVCIQEIEDSSTPDSTQRGGVTIDGLYIDVERVDKASMRNAVNEALRNLGYTVTNAWTEPAIFAENSSPIAINVRRDGANYAFSMTYHDFFTVKLNGEVYDTVAYGKGTTLTNGAVKAAATTGTHYKLDVDGAESYALATDLTAGDTASFRTSVTAPVAVETGFVNVGSAPVFSSGSSGVTAAVSSGYTWNSFVKVGATIPVDVVVAANPTAMKGATVTVNTSNWGSASADLTLAEVKAGKTVTLNLTANTGNIGTTKTVTLTEKTSDQAEAASVQEFDASSDPTVSSVMDGILQELAAGGETTPAQKANLSNAVKNAMEIGETYAIEPEILRNLPGGYSYAAGATIAMKFNNPSTQKLWVVIKDSSGAVKFIDNTGGNLAAGEQFVYFSVQDLRHSNPDWPSTTAVSGDASKGKLNPGEAYSWEILGGSVTDGNVSNGEISGGTVVASGTFLCPAELPTTAPEIEASPSENMSADSPPKAVKDVLDAIATNGSATAEHQAALSAALKETLPEGVSTVDKEILKKLAAGYNDAAGKTITIKWDNGTGGQRWVVIRDAAGAIKFIDKTPESTGGGVQFTYFSVQELSHSTPTYGSGSLTAGEGYTWTLYDLTNTNGTGTPAFGTTNGSALSTHVIAHGTFIAP